MVIIKENNMKQNRPRIVCIDFDDTIVANSFPDSFQGQLKQDAKEVINKLVDDGFYVIIWTSRYLEKDIKNCIDFLKANDIHYHTINQNYPHLQFKPTPKIYGDCYIDDRALINVDWKWIQQYINVKLVETDLYTLTPEMRERFFIRTKNHIELAHKYYNKYTRIKGIKTNASLMCKNHDYIKFQEPELAPYIAINWNYYCKYNGIEFDISDKLKATMNQATEHHVRNSPHHPEYWSDRTDDLIPKNDRDKFDPNSVPTIDVSETMPEGAIIEMCADWCAMSQERMNTPFEWADKVIDKRWKFGEEKTKFIYEVLNTMWN